MQHVRRIRTLARPSRYFAADPLMIRAIPSAGAIETYVSDREADPLLLRELEPLGLDLIRPYRWRPDGPGTDPAAELRVHRVTTVDGGRLVSATVEAGIVHMSIVKAAATREFCVALEAHSGALMRLMM